MGLNKTLLGGLSATALGVAFAVASVGSAQAAYVAPTSVTWADNGTVNDPSRSDTSSVNAPGGEFLSLGLGGWAVFDFGYERTASAADGIVVETTYNCIDTNDDGECSHYAETAEVYASTNWDGTYDEDTPIDLTHGTWEYITEIPNGDAQGGFQFEVDQNFRWLALVDTSGNNSEDGFDVDHIAVTPLPAAAWFMLTAIGGLFGSRWLKGRRGAQQAA